MGNISPVRQTYLIILVPPFKAYFCFDLTKIPEFAEFFAIDLTLNLQRLIKQVVAHSFCGDEKTPISKHRIVFMLR
jgi:hypothetical protein